MEKTHSPRERKQIIPLALINNPLLVILGLALLVRVGWILYTPGLPTSDFASYKSMAIRIAAGQGLPTVVRHAPGYAIFLGGVFVVTGYNLLIAKIINALLGTLACWLSLEYDKCSINTAHKINTSAKPESNTKKGA